MKGRDVIMDVLQSEGASKNDPDSKFDKKELMMGIEVEMEHTDKRAEAKEIAKDHLRENPKYYTELKKSGIDRH